jgi:hypothetical protein
MGAHKYTENAFYASWKASDSERIQMVIMDGGNYLAASHGFGSPEFICWLGLASTPRSEWRASVTSAIEGLNSFESVSRFPWGDDFFVGKQMGVIDVGRKFNLGSNYWDGSSNLVGVDSYTDSQVMAGGEVIAQLHSEAIDAGWRIALMTLHEGRCGPYQQYEIVRDRPREGKWSA